MDRAAAPPAHKASPLVLTIDAQNGMLLEQRSVQFGVISRWTEIESVDGHDEALFQWDGPAEWYTTETSEYTEEDQAADARADVEKMTALGIPPLELTIGIPLHPYQSDEHGAFYAAFRTDIYGTIQRRPKAMSRGISARTSTRKCAGPTTSGTGASRATTCRANLPRSVANSRRPWTDPPTANPLSPKCWRPAQAPRTRACVSSNSPARAACPSTR
ncbi:MAG: hypothetical protein JWR83_2188 [Aeromicrobium sp.]|nr:hypothetical protein [Aeromicrobium sp.]